MRTIGNKIASIRDIMSIWPTVAEMSRDLQVNQRSLYSMWNRHKINARYWPALIEAAHRRGHKEVSSELLMQLHAKQGGQEIARNEATDSKFVAKHILSAAENGGHFSKFRNMQRARFASIDQVDEHIAALRDEWDR